jgi:hypothetical protein
MPNSSPFLDRWTGDFKTSKYRCRRFKPDGSFEIVEGPFAIGQPVNWNCQGAVDEPSVRADINQDGEFGLLLTWDDWTTLRFEGGAIGDLNLLPQPRVTSAEVEPTLPEVMQQQRRLAGDTVAPKIVLRGPRRGRRRVRLTVVATDNKQLAGVTIKVGRKPLRTVGAKGKKQRRKMTTTITLGRGRHDVRVVAIDAAGGQSPVRRLRVMVSR